MYNYNLRERLDTIIPGCNINTMPDPIQEQTPERATEFCLDSLLGTFTAFENECSAEYLMSAKLPLTVFPFYNDNRWHNYIYSNNWKIGTDIYTSTHIQIIANGLKGNYPTLAKKMGQHNPKTFQQLDLNDHHLKTVLEPIFRYGAAFFEIALNDLKKKAWHCYDASRLDFEMVDDKNKKILHIIFGPGFPHQGFFTNTWQ